MDARWELAHVCVGVDDLESAMELYGETFRTGWTDVLNIDIEWLAPLRPEGKILFRGRGALSTLPGPRPTIELFTGPPVFELAPGAHVLHHVGYYADDLVERAEELERAGFRLEYTIPTVDGRMKGFMYHLHPNGTRIETIDSRGKGPIEAWQRGAAHDISWLTE